MSNNKLLLTNAERLGLRNPPSIQKAETFLRVLSCKPCAKTLSDAAKVVLCLDLAASSLGLTFNKESALKLTGLRKSAYQNNLNNIEKILNVDKPVTISELCVQLSCPEAKGMAVEVFNSYKESDGKIKDIAHPQYMAAALYTACKLKSIKIDKAQLKSISRLKTPQWKELLDEFSKFADSLGLISAKKSTKKSAAEKFDSSHQVEPCNHKSRSKEKEEVEDYQVWKERILREATLEILKKEIERD